MSGFFSDLFTAFKKARHLFCRGCTTELGSSPLSQPRCANRVILICSCAVTRCGYSCHLSHQHQPSHDLPKSTESRDIFHSFTFNRLRTFQSQIFSLKGRSSKAIGFQAAKWHNRVPKLLATTLQYSLRQPHLVHSRRRNTTPAGNQAKTTLLPRRNPRDLHPSAEETHPNTCQPSEPAHATTASETRILDEIAGRAFPSSGMFRIFHICFWLRRLGVGCGGVPGTSSW